MNFFDNVFGAAGCNPDGTLGQNALTQFVDANVDQTALLAAQQQHHQVQAFESYQEYQAANAAMAQQQQLAAAGQSQHIQQSQNQSFVNRPFMWSQQQQYMANGMMMGMHPGMMGMQGMMMPGMMMPQMMGMPPPPLQHHHMPRHIQRARAEEADEVVEEDMEGEVEDEVEAFLQTQEAVENRSLNATNWALDEASGATTTVSDAHSIQDDFRAAYYDNMRSQSQQHQAGDIVISSKVDATYHFEADNPYVQVVGDRLKVNGSMHLQEAADRGEDEAEEDIHLRALYRQGLRYYTQGHLQPAILSFQAVVQHNTSSTAGSKDEEADNACAADSWRMLGLCHAENDQDSQAIVCLRRALELDPYAVDTLPHLATCLCNEQEVVQALDTIKQWVLASPSLSALAIDSEVVSDAAQVHAGTLLGEVLDLLQRASSYTSAAAPSAAALQQQIDCQVMLGIVHNLALEYDAAVTSFRTALSLRAEMKELVGEGMDEEMDLGDHALSNKLAATLANSDHSDLALPLYASLLRTRPRFARGHMNQGIAYANLHAYQEAAQSYVRALHLSPEAKHIWGYLRVALSCLERFDLVQLSSQESNLYVIAQKLGLDDLQA